MRSLKLLLSTIIIVLFCNSLFADTTGTTDTLDKKTGKVMVNYIVSTLFSNKNLGDTDEDSLNSLLMKLGFQGNCLFLNKDGGIKLANCLQINIGSIKYEKSINILKTNMLNQEINKTISTDNLFLIVSLKCTNECNAKIQPYLFEAKVIDSTGSEYDSYMSKDAQTPSLNPGITKEINFVFEVDKKQKYLLILKLSLDPREWYFRLF